MVGRLSITGGSAFACYSIIDSLPAYYTQAPLIGPLVATTLCAVIGFLLTGILVTILDVASESLLICYLADSEMAEHGGVAMHARGKVSMLVLNFVATTNVGSTRW